LAGGSREKRDIVRAPKVLLAALGALREDNERAGLAQEAWTAGQPLFSRYPEVYVIQDMRCRLAMRLRPRELTAGLCSDRVVTGQAPRGRAQPRIFKQKKQLAFSLQRAGIASRPVAFISFR